MKISIDTSEDSDEEIRQAITLLKSLLDDSGSDEFDPSDATDGGDGGIFGAFDEDDDEPKDLDDDVDEDVEVVTF